MDRQLDALDARVPALEPGVTMLAADERSMGHHHLVLGALQDDRGPVIWIDAGDTASTYALHDLTHNPRLLGGIRIARAWTAYQHHTLIKRAVERASPRTKLVVVPNVDILYRSDDIADDEAMWLLRTSLTLLAELASALSLPVLATAADPDRLPVTELIDHELEWEDSPEGGTFAGEAGRSLLYRGHWWWQTTIPYWVDLVGVRTDEPWATTPALGQPEPALLEY